MSNPLHSVITGTGTYLPSKKVVNTDFLKHEFYETDGRKLDKDNQDVINKFFEITTIKERRYVQDDQVTSDIAFLAAQKAIADADIDPEELDYIIVAHNFGDVKHGSNRTDMVPALASRVKFSLKIQKCRYSSHRGVSRPGNDHGHYLIGNIINTI